MADGAILGQRAVKLPDDTTANRPTPTVGMIRYNTTLSALEYTDGTSWYTIGQTGVNSTTSSAATTGKAIAMAIVFGG